MNIELVIAYAVGFISCASVALVAYLLGMAHGTALAERERCVCDLLKEIEGNKGGEDDE